MDASDYIKQRRQRMVTSDVLGKRTQFNEGRRVWVRIQGNSGNYESTYQEISQGTVELTPAEYEEIVAGASVGEYTFTSAFDVLYNANTYELTITIPELNAPYFDTYNFYLVGSFDQSKVDDQVWSIMPKMTRAGSTLTLSPCTFTNVNYLGCKLFAYTSISTSTTAPPWSGDPNVDLYGGFSSENQQSYAVYHTAKPAPFNFDFFRFNSLNNIYLDQDLPIQVIEGVVEMNYSYGLTIVSVERNSSNDIVITYTNDNEGDISGVIVNSGDYTRVTDNTITFLATTINGTITIPNDVAFVIGNTYRVMDISGINTTHVVYYFAQFTVPDNYTPSATLFTSAIPTIPGFSASSIAFSGALSPSPYSYVTVASNNDPDFSFAENEAFTIEWFQYMSEPHINARPFSIGSFGAGIKIAVSYEGSLIFWMNNDPKFSFPGYLDIAYMTNAWIHVAIVRDSSGLVTIYINGKYIGTDTISDAVSVSTTDDLTIGNETSPTDAGVFTGNITNFRWVKGDALYNGNFNDELPTTPLSAVPGTKLLLLASTLGTVTDDSSGLIKAVTGHNVGWFPPPI